MKVTCGDCQGDGVVAVSRMYLDPADSSSCTIKAPGHCPACRGTGLIERPRSTAGETADD